jgi:hypothetical protein
VHGSHLSGDGGGEPDGGGHHDQGSPTHLHLRVLREKNVDNDILSLLEREKLQGSRSITVRTCLYCTDNSSNNL